MRDELKESTQQVLNTKYHYGKIEEVAKLKYEEKNIENSWSKLAPNGSYHGYVGFEVLDPGLIRINYIYGAGDMEFNGHFLWEPFAI